MEETKQAQVTNKPGTNGNDTPGQKFGDHETGKQIAKMDSTTEMVEFELGEIPNANALASLNEMKPGKSYVAKYRTQEDWQMFKDKPVRCFFLGIKEITNDKGEALQAAVFAEENGIFLCSQKLLLDATRHLHYMTPVIVTYTGKKKNKSNEGSTNTFDVIELTRPKDV